MNRSIPFLILLLLIAEILCCHAVFGQGKNDSASRFAVVDGRRLEFSMVSHDTYYLSDSRITNKMYRQVTVDESFPIKVNGENISTTNEEQQKFFSNYVLAKLQKELGMLPDGNYSLNLRNIVYNKKGELIYFEYDEFGGGITKTNGEIAGTAGIRNAIKSQLISLIKNPDAKPVFSREQKVYLLIRRPFETLTINVKANQVTIF